MRDRLIELLPLVLVGVVLLAFQLTRGGLPELATQRLVHVVATPAPPSTPVIDVGGLQTGSARRAAPDPSTARAGISCNSAQPRFVGGMATLKGALGAAMGDPLECEQSTSDRGDTQQKTTTGLAYYRTQLNAACFTTGWDHWSWIDGRLVHWVGGDIDPPPDAAVLRY